MAKTGISGSRVSKFEKSNVKFFEKKKELVQSIGSFEKSTIRKMGGKITVFD